MRGKYHNDNVLLENTCLEGICRGIKQLLTGYCMLLEC